MISARMSAALVGAAMMTGCGMLGGETEPLQTAAPGQGTEFTRALAEEYQELSSFEYDQSYDWRDAAYYATKAERSAQGEAVMPSDPAQWSIEEDKLGELQTARSRLLAALEGGAAGEKPEVAAHAQSQYDCWVEEQEEGWQLQNISYCREQFELALAELERPLPTAAAPMTTPPPAPQPTMARDFLVFFEFDQDELTPEARQVLEEAASCIRDACAANQVTQISVTGHADRAGPPEYNEQLSERRAQSVQQALADLGVPADAITVSAVGETEPLVQTGDGVAEPQNRRVQINVQ